MENSHNSTLSKLRKWQVEPANRLLEILRAGGNAVDLSDTGTGKSYVACAVAAALGENTLAVVPKIAVSMWHRVAEEFGAPLQAIGYEAVRTGQTIYGTWQHQRQKAEEQFVCMNCQCVVDLDDYRPCHCHPAGLHCIKTKRKPHRYGKFIWDDVVDFLIFDEIHRCSGLDSLNADMLIAAKRQNIRVLGLSATAACTPLQMRALGFSLDLHGLNQAMAVYPKPTAVDLSQNPPIFSPVKHLPSFYQWAGRYDCRPDPVYRGLKWFASATDQKNIMADIHSRILPSRGVRVRTSGIPGFPERLITAELFDLEKDYEIEKLYAEMAKALDALSLRAAQDANSESPLTQIIRARQRISLLKIPILVELAEDELAKGNSVAIFVNFRATLQELSKRLSAYNPGAVDGSAEGVRCRDAAIAGFQRNDNRVILLNSAAGGVAIGLQDLHGGHPRVALVEPTFSAAQMLQIFGRLPRDGGKSLSRYRIILAANTIETRIQKAFEAKQHCIEALNDSDLDPLTTPLA